MYEPHGRDHQTDLARAIAAAPDHFGPYRTFERADAFDVESIGNPREFPFHHAGRCAVLHMGFETEKCFSNGEDMAGELDQAIQVFDVVGPGAFERGDFNELISGGLENPPVLEIEMEQTAVDLDDVRMIC
ncbi:hypothetical protein KBB96_02715 [Luteolibacter ambystomatis]|uniref:Uncharacterized protein n=1 Tax=Luteolibacter ambystomatis TaxID=2824561 RepID=A0A975J0K6_9BACT|nr:hypothetical protein [Luteolibacter ambystomatis]QUE51810.1 hypothetical protein KBB96_02715 [Luteolibacter ambystomatis]